MPGANRFFSTVHSSRNSTNLSAPKLSSRRPLVRGDETPQPWEIDVVEDGDVATPEGGPQLSSPGDRGDHGRLEIDDDGVAVYVADDVSVSVGVAGVYLPYSEARVTEYFGNLAQERPGLFVVLNLLAAMNSVTKLHSPMSQSADVVRATRSLPNLCRVRALAIFLLYIAALETIDCV